MTTKRINPLKPVLLGAVIAVFTQTACASSQIKQRQTLKLSNETANEVFSQVGNANWTFENGIIEARSGSGFLVTKESYQDFHLRLEFMASRETNSGVFFRCGNSQEVNDKSCYEANIFDTRPDQTFRTGAITGLAQPKKIISTEDGAWHSYEIIAVGERLRVVLDGHETVYTRDAKHKAGPIALQLAQGAIKFRNISIEHLKAGALGPSPASIDGVWELSGFTLTDAQGKTTDWCKGSYGVIMYVDGYMSTAINCTSNPTKVLLYSGPFEFDGTQVFHQARNYSDPSLNKVFRRSVAMKDQNHLTLSGPLNDGGVATVNWVRR